MQLFQHLFFCSKELMTVARAPLTITFTSYMHSQKWANPKKANLFQTTIFRAPCRNRTVRLCGMSIPRETNFCPAASAVVALHFWSGWWRPGNNQLGFPSSSQIRMCLVSVAAIGWSIPDICKYKIQHCTKQNFSNLMTKVPATKSQSRLRSSEGFPSRIL